MNDRPLSGIKVLDLTWVYSGPHCTALLRDFGADVVKIEGPGFGDHTRLFPPMNGGDSGYFYMLNHGKKSVALNLKQPKAKEIFLELVKQVDVVAENFVPGTLDKLGLGYEELKKVNPAIILASIYGFGSFGPYSSLPGVDPVAQAMGGLMSLTGLPETPPLKTGPAVADAIAGIYLASGILAALLERHKTGLGKRIEVSMMDAVFTVLEESVIRASMTGDALPARGNTDPLGAPWDAFPTKDHKWVMVCSLGGNRFYNIYSKIGRNDLAEAYKGDGPEASVKRANDLKLLNKAFAEWSINHNAEDVMALMREDRVPCGVVKDVTELLEDPHLIARNMVAAVDHPVLGQIKTYNQPVMFDGDNFGIDTNDPADYMDPDLGEHNRIILGELLGMDDETIATLYAENVLWAGKKEE